MRKLSRSNEEKMKFKMSGKIEVEPHVDAIKMPGNLKSRVDDRTTSQAMSKYGMSFSILWVCIRTVAISCAFGPAACLSR